MQNQEGRYQPDCLSPDLYASSSPRFYPIRTVNCSKLMESLRGRWRVGVKVTIQHIQQTTRIYLLAIQNLFISYLYLSKDFAFQSLWNFHYFPPLLNCSFRPQYLCALSPLTSPFFLIKLSSYSKVLFAPFAEQNWGSSAHCSSQRHDWAGVMECEAHPLRSTLVQHRQCSPREEFCNHQLLYLLPAKLGTDLRIKDLEFDFEMKGNSR